MTKPIESLIATGTKVWLDSIDPDELDRNRAWGITGATSNPIIIADLIKTGRLDGQITEAIKKGAADEDIAWRMTDAMVKHAQQVFRPVWESTRGDDGYVSFELDPLLEDPGRNLPVAERTRRYVELGKEWGTGRENRMIKIPATPGGLGALTELAAAGITLNVTLIFTPRQYIAARDAIWLGAQRLGSRQAFKSVYSIFVSRVDVYTEKHVPTLTDRAQGLVGIVNAKQIWRMNRDFWADKGLPLKQEMIFASTGTKKPEDPAWKYVAAFAGSDIETNPPATNAKVQESGQAFTRQLDQLPPDEILVEIDQKVDLDAMESVLMAEGVQKFADPQKALLAQIAETRSKLEPVAAR